MKRITLIKPYEIINGTGDYWMVNYFYFDKNQPWKDRQRVDSFTIADSVIVIECNNCIYDSNIHKKYYTVIIPKNKTEMTFLEENVFNQYLQRSNIKLGRKFSPKETYIKWEKGEPLPWPKINLAYETQEQATIKKE